MIINLFRLYKFTVALMHKRKYIYIVINYIYIIKLYEKKKLKEPPELQLTSWVKKKHSDGKEK